MNSKIRVLIVDDHQLFIDGLKAFLVGVPDIAVIGQALHGRQALTQLMATKIDVILMDLDMPEMNGLDATREILNRFPDVKILIVSMHERPLRIQQLMEVGAHGYLPKNTSKEELIEAITTVSAGKEYYSPALIQKLAQSKMQAEAPLVITPREQQVLEGIVRGEKTDEIAQHLGIGNQTVQTYRKNLLKKLKVKNTASLVRQALVLGLVNSGQ